jgi:regulator of sirC expression with transglutaminase-like and TPR domain
MTEERAAHEAWLRGIAGAGDAPVDIAEAALRLASFDRPRVDLARYRDHLAELAGGVAAGGADAAVALAETMARHGYEGDTLTYDDLQNANLIRVIDRKKGLPVALGILYLHAGRAQGWEMEGLAFPGHFLVRLERRFILDPFNGGRLCDAALLRKLLHATAGPVELAPEHYAAVSDRAILLRLQNNIKLRLLKDDPGKALDVLERMLLFAPEEAALRLEAGYLSMQVGKLRAAAAYLERALAEGDDRLRHRAAALLQQLRGQMN